MNIAVTTSHIRKSYGERAVLRSVDLSIRHGQVAALFGRNGGGKSTLIRVLASITKPDSGSVNIDGIDIAAKPAAARRRLGVIGHKSSLDQHLTLFENLRLAAGLYAIPTAEWRPRADALLERLHLKEYAQHPVSTFSRGTTQRAAIARALIHDPRILLLDEPFTGLDLRGIDIVTELVCIWRAENRAVLLVSHQFREAAELADDILVLHDGEIHVPPPERAGDLDHLESRYRAMLRQG